MAFDKNAKAVEALHKTMVMLREELAKKNQKIKILESRLNRDLEAIEVEKKEEEVKIVVSGNNNYEYDDKIDDFIDESIVTEDPVMDFVMSEEEEGNDQNEKNLDSMKISDVKIQIEFLIIIQISILLWLCRKLWWPFDPTTQV